MSRFMPLVLDDADALDSVEDVWNRLWAVTRPLPPMLEYRWVRTWWEIHRRAGKLLIVILIDGDGQARGLAPLTRAVPMATRPTFRIAVRPLDEYIAGLGSANFRHRCRRALRAGVEAGVELVTATRPAQIAELFAVLRGLHQQRWSRRGH